MADDRALKTNPLSEADAIMSQDFYGSKDTADIQQKRKPAKKKPKPTHYKVICISMYTKDIEELEAKVAELKRRGHTKANKSQLIRFALRQVDIDKLQPPV